MNTNVILFSFISLIIIFSLPSCSEETKIKDYKTENAQAKGVLECKTRPDSLEKTLCTEVVLQNYPDKWVSNCALNNINGKETLSNNMKDGKMSDKDIKDVDDVLNECSYYKTSINEQAKNDSSVSSINENSSSPIFTGFVSGVAGGFVGNYIANKMSTKREEDNYSGSTGTSGYVGTSGNSNSTIDKNGNSGTKTSTIDKIDSKHKTDNWNIKEMKTKSATKSNYSLGDSGKTWSKVQSTKAASARSSTTSRSSWGSSTSKSSSSLG